MPTQAIQFNIGQLCKDLSKYLLRYQLRKQLFLLLRFKVFQMKIKTINQRFNRKRNYRVNERVARPLRGITHSHHTWYAPPTIHNFLMSMPFWSS